MTYRMLISVLTSTLVCPAQSLSIATLKLNSRLELSDSKGTVCVVKLFDRNAQGFGVSVSQRTSACGPGGRHFRIEAADILSVSRYHETGTTRARRGLAVAAMSSAIIVTGVAVAFRTEKGVASLAIVAGGLTALTLHLARQDIRYSVLVRRLP